MPFLTSNPNLSNTVFTDKELQLARKVLQTVISREDNSWLKKPQGILGEYWQRDDTQASCFLIDIARMIDTLENRVTDKSISHLYEKVRQLLRPPSTEQFIEVLTEFQVAFSLVQYASPLKLLTSEDIIEPKVQRAPDFVFQTPEGLVLIETTVFHGGILDKWTQSVNYIKHSLQNQLIKRNPPLNIHISLPLRAEIDDKQIVDIVLRETVSKNTGSISIGGKGMIQWEPFPIITSQDRSSIIAETTAPVAAFISPGVTIDRAFASSTQITFPTEEDVNQAKALVLKSLRNKLRDKKGQFPKDDSETHIIVMRIEHNALGEGDIATMLIERIWPNKDEYNWLSGIVFYTPMQGFFLSEKTKARLNLYLNPNAVCSTSTSLINLFNGKATFHYKTWEEPPLTTEQLTD